MSSKDLNEILNKTNTEIGFNSTKSSSKNNLLIFGITNPDINESNFNCDAYIYNDKVKKKSKNCIGKIINSKDTIKSIDQFDFVLINDPKNVNFNMFSYEKGIGLRIDSKINDERKDTIENFEFDFLIYDLKIDSLTNFEDMLTIKDMINSIRSNWVLNIKTPKLEEIDFQYIFDIGFTGIMVNLTEIDNKKFKETKSKLNNLEVRKSGKF
ncbi:MAG: hypothetical protein FI682_05130 [SAR202 cluster bacterium]|nr:hypothetical protein [SAR202 cluster bacterium]RZP18300.1 MAG: hypothetical protein EVA33_01075 [Chloroflexota bacterium]